MSRFKLVRFYDLIVLIYHLHRFTQKYEHNNIDKSYAQITKHVTPKKWVSKQDLEHLLYCCNLLSEDGEFWHPDDIDFDQFLREVQKRYELSDFDKLRNYFKEGEQNES